MLTRTAEKTYRTPQLASAAEITYRQADYWARIGLLVPSVLVAEGSGSQRLYSEDDLMLAKSISHLLKRGVSFQRIREWVEHGEGDQIGIREAIRRGNRQWDPGIRLDLTSLRNQSAAEGIRLSA